MKLSDFSKKEVTIQMNDLLLLRLRPHKDESELRLLEKRLSEKLNKLVVCSYDSVMSHKHFDKEEFEYRVKESKSNLFSNLADYIINYEVYDTIEDALKCNGGVGGKVHEVTYLIDNAGYIVITSV